MSRETSVRPSEAGFTLAEMLVSVAVMSILVLAILAVFDLNNRVSRVQVNVTDMQQSLRVAQYDLVRNLRMAGRGGLPRDIAVQVRNNEGLAAQQNILVGNGGSPKVVRGSDVVTIRGVLSSPIWHVNTTVSTEFVVNADGKGGTVTIRNPGPTGVPQVLTALKQAFDDGVREPLLLTSPLSDAIYAVVEFDPSPLRTFIDVAAGTATIAFRITEGTYTDQYRALYGTPATFPLQTCATVGILEEYRLYVRDADRATVATGSLSAPKLAMARVFPGTEVGYHRGPGVEPNPNPNRQLDVADNILDLQVALAVDRVVPATGLPDGVIQEPPAVPANADEWVFNAAGEAMQPGNLAYIRVNTVARTDRADPQYVAPILAPLEDRSYDDTNVTKINDPNAPDRRYRRRVLTTIVDLRNLG